MTLTLTLPDDTAERLRYDAARRGLPAETIVLQLLAQHLPREADDARKRAAAIEMLSRWQDEDAAGDTDGLADADELLAALARNRGIELAPAANGTGRAAGGDRP